MVPATLALSMGLCVIAPPTRADVTHTVTMEDDRFAPATLVIDVGDTVVWRNDGDLTHTTTSADNWDSGDLEPGGSFTFTFTRAGRYEYLCLHHDEMRGVIVVGASGPSPSPRPSTAPDSAMAPVGGPDHAALAAGVALLIGAALVAAGASTRMRRRRT